MIRSSRGVAAALALGLALALAASPAAAAGKPRAKAKKKAVAAAEPKPLDERSVDEILAQYTFVGDFSEKDPRREVSDELFWPYALKLPPVTFPLDDRFKLEDDMPRTDGGGRAYEHLNRGRLLFRDGEYLKATNTWLTGRALFGTKYPHHRRSDYFIGMGFLRQAQAMEREKKDEAMTRATFDNATTFFSWAFVVKTDVPDPLLEKLTPKGLYNLAAIYWLFDRKAGAYGAASTGLNYLRKTGRNEYRPQLHRFVAEAAIARQDWLGAIQELDTAIRQDRNLGQAAAAFARVGDIYFTLGNYDLAEDAYALGARLDEATGHINPAQLVLRGESLFWLGRFSEAQKILDYALERHLPPVVPGQDGEAGDGPRIRAPETMTTEMRAWASLRIADAFLARWSKEKDKHGQAARDLKERAALAYFKVAHDFRELEAGHTAQVRQACLDLPGYDEKKGHNVEHARELLEEAKAGSLPDQARELAWACQVTSYTDRERTPEMLERVRAFANANPDVRFLKPFEGPVRSYQAGRIDELFAAGDLYRAVSFFEKNRKTLFPKVEPRLQRQLFEAYADLHRSPAAAEFWSAYAGEPDSDLKTLRQVTVAAELAEDKVKGPWAARSLDFQKSLPKRAWRVPPGKLVVTYLARVRSLEHGSGHVPWMYNLARHFAETESAYVCDLEYPLLSRLAALGDAHKAQVDQRLGQLVASELPGLFRADESCALSLLELEAARLRPDPRALAGRYLKRQGWPLVAGFLHLYWTISEHVFDAGDAADARKLWEVIRDKGPPASPEVEFAKARLDPTKTEFEKLWN